MSPLLFAAPTDEAIDLVALNSETFTNWIAEQPETVQNWAKQNGFKGAANQVLSVPGDDGTLATTLVGLGEPQNDMRTRFVFGGIRNKLPDATYRLIWTGETSALEEAALGWLLAGYRFDKYKKKSPPGAQLIAPEAIDRARLEAIASGEALTRDLINTPASDMGPEHLSQAAQNLASTFDASFAEVVGEDLLADNFPLIHAVGRASDRSPRLLEMNWGTEGPHLTLVGKGICFDTGGLNLKPGASMGLMKKDMGGAATVLGLAQMIMSLELPLRLRILIPAAENSVAGSSFRPGDVLTSRLGKTIEVNNTDAEGRLVLADALALATEQDTDLVVSMATLTGAARVAVGPDLAPFFTDSETVASSLRDAANAVKDPVWQLPFWDPYEARIEPGIADLDNAPAGGMAGAITAALFLRRFVQNNTHYVHFDIYGWQPTSAPARPKGGVGQGARALLAALPEILDL